MSTTIAAALMIGGPVLAAVFTIGVMALVGLVAYDAVSSRRSATAGAEAKQAARVTTRESAETRIYLQRWIARAFVLLGGAFWGVMLVASAVWHSTGLESMFFVALIPVLLNMGALVLGWRYERSASVMLALTSVGAVWWGVLSGYEAGVWMLFTVLLIGPMLTAAVLFWLARRGEVALALHMATVPEMALIPAESPRN
jgi:hypothetical protein